MNELMTHTVRSGRELLLFLFLLPAPLLAVVLLNPAVRNGADAASVNGLITFPVVLVAAVAIYFHWRMSRHRPMAWLAVALIVTAVVGTTQSALLLAAPTHLLMQGVWLRVPQLGLGLVLLVLTLAAGHRRMRRDPALVGLALGGILALTLLVVPLTIGPLHAPDAVTVPLDLVVVTTALAIAAVLLRLTTVKLWARRRLAASVLLIEAGQSLSHVAHDSLAANGLVMLVSIVGAALLCATALALLRWSFGESTYALVVLHEQLEEVEAEVRVDRERLHEIGSTIAGIASATHVIRQSFGVSTQQRHLLEEMLEAEVERLERLMTTRAPLTVRAFSVDDTLQQLVVSQQARGRTVHWVPTGHRAVGQPDELAETVHILLENAARHSGTGVVTIEVCDVDDAVEIVVSDDGPGVPVELRPTLFDWGARSLDSPGQGIGLHIARTLMNKNGGSLDLDATASSGARFVARLPIVRVVHAASGHVA